MKVWKYPVPIVGDGRVTLSVPGGVVMSVQMQRGEPCLWMGVDPEMPKQERCFEWVGTGHDVPSHVIQYVGTVQSNGGVFVWHLFEVPPPAARDAERGGGSQCEHPG